MKNILATYTKLQWRWSFYDWANSSYALVITSTIFPIYFLNMTQNHGSLVQIGPWLVKNAALFSYILSVSFLTVIAIAPILASYADRFHARRFFMKFFAILGGASCALLYFFNEKHIEIGIVNFYIATVSYSMGILFYNSFLPNVATTSEQDRVSALGFAMGFLGSVLLQVVIFVLLFQHTFFHITELVAIKIGFILVGVWWSGFGFYASTAMPEAKSSEPAASLLYSTRTYISIILNTARSIFTDRYLRIFIPSYFLYTMGLQTVMFLATLFGKDAIGMKDDQLIITIFLIQLLGILGAFLASWLSARLGNVLVLTALVVIWILICLGVYFYVYTSFAFMITAACVGIVMGGMQSLSRSTFSKLLPNQEQKATQFIFFDLTEKLAIVIGTLVFGWVVQLCGELRPALLPLIFFFGTAFIGLLFLLSNQKK